MAIDPEVERQWNIEEALAKELHHWLMPDWYDFTKVCKKHIIVKEISLICFHCGSVVKCRVSGIEKDQRLLRRCKEKL